MALWFSGHLCNGLLLCITAVVLLVQVAECRVHSSVVHVGVLLPNMSSTLLRELSDLPCSNLSMVQAESSLTMATLREMFGWLEHDENRRRENKIESSNDDDENIRRENKIESSKSNSQRVDNNSSQRTGNTSVEIWFSYHDTECSDTQGPIEAMELYYKKNSVNVLFGPCCNYALSPVGR